MAQYLKVKDILLFSKMPIQALMPTQHSTELIPGVKRPGRMADQYRLQLAPRLRMSGAMSTLPNMPSRRAQGKLYFILHITLTEYTHIYSS